MGKVYPQSIWPRHNAAWSPAEDAKLMKLANGGNKICGECGNVTQRPNWNKIAKELGRTSMGVQTRFYALRSAMKYVEFRDKKESK